MDLFKNWSDFGIGEALETIIFKLIVSDLNIKFNWEGMTHVRISCAKGVWYFECGELNKLTEVKSGELEEVKALFEEA